MYSASLYLMYYLTLVGLLVSLGLWLVIDDLTKPHTTTKED